MTDLRSGPVHDDCISLKRAFLFKHSTSFSDFKDAWCELCFYSVHKLITEKNSRNVETFIDMIYKAGMDWITAIPTSQILASPMRESMHVSSSTSPSAEICGKLAGVYLIWSIFYTHDFKPSVLVRTTLEAWSEICQFHDYLRENKFQEGDFMLSQLKADSAFLICFSANPMCAPATIASCKFPKKQLLAPFCPSSLPSSSLSSLFSSIQPCIANYAQHKQQLSSFLPPHLLTNSTLTADLEQLLNSEN